MTDSSESAPLTPTGVRNRATPPSEWCDWWDGPVTMLTPDIGYGQVPDRLTAAPDDPNPWFWHWCTSAAFGEGRWMCASTRAHTLVSREPLHLEPSLLWPCCGTHGWVRNGAWQPA